MTSQEKYALLDKLGLCHKCEKAKPMPNRKYCPECLEKIALDNAKRYDSQKAHEYQSRRREIYQQKKEQGICVRCTKKATHGLYCYEHSIGAKRHNSETASRRKRERHERGLIPDFRRENRLCLYCAEPIEEENNTQICNACRKKASEYSAMADKTEWRNWFNTFIFKNKGNNKNKEGIQCKNT